MAEPIQFFGGSTSAVTINPSTGATTSSLIDSDFSGDNAKYKVVTQNGRQYVADSSGNQVFILVTGSGKNVKYQVISDLTKAQASYIKGFSGGLPALKKALLNSGYISKQEYANNSYIGGLIGAISDLSIQSVQGYAYEGKTEFQSMSSFLSKQKSDTGTTSKAGTFKDTLTDITTVGDANKEINDYMLDVFGREATQEEKDAFYKDINARELKSGVETVEVRDATGKISKRTRTGAPLTSDERINSLNAVVKTALKGTDAETILSSSKGSKIAQDIAKIQKSAADYGQPMSSGDAMKYILDGFGVSDYVAKQTERLRLNAMTLYSNLKDHIQSGGTVKDIADQYAIYKGRVLELPDTAVSIFDDDIQAALTNKDATGKSQTGVMSLTDFQVNLRKDARWSKTNNAREEASSYANDILRSFGLVG
jgi:hypothetical protein